MTKWTKASAGLVRSRVFVGGSLLVAAAWVAGCGGGSKPADSPGNCPDGTVLRGSDCVPPSSANDSPASDPDTKTPSSTPATPPKSASADEDHPAGASATSDTASSGDKAPYDRDWVERELKRGARQVKTNCGAATDDDGKAAGPWGRTKASITLGRNGHIKQVTVPAPFDGTPVGLCVVHAFDKIQFPPYANSSDVTVDWDIDIVQPKH
ncbi:MAG TPA: hypothetical protein VK841_12175 [Polyangiaceae bacterium]|jgi:hypothetical protein|nr:hypothetical protein [Polyangiaceae bacterium]